MIAHNGVPVVFPLKYPLRISGISLSFLEVDIEFFQVLFSSFLYQSYQGQVQFPKEDHLYLYL